MSLETLGYAFLGGLLPSLIWLYFLLKEDSRCPEPRSMIWLAFLAGILAVPDVLPFEQYAQTMLTGGSSVIIAWAVIEEVLKYAAAAAFILWRRAVNESPDYVIYMLTVALGFAAAENMLFLLAPLAGGHFTESLVTGNLRFIGSTLLHVFASSAIGFALAFSYMKPRGKRILYASGGLVLAVALHAAFNAFIIARGGANAFAGFFLVWTAAVVFFALFEILKYFRYRGRAANTC